MPFFPIFSIITFLSLFFTPPARIVMEVSLFLILDYCFIETDSYRDAEAQKLGFVSGAGVHLMHVDRLILITLIKLFI